MIIFQNFCQEQLSKAYMERGYEDEPGVLPVNTPACCNIFALSSSNSLTMWLRVFQQQDASQEEAFIILLFEAANYKEKSTSKPFQVSRDLLYVLF